MAEISAKQFLMVAFFLALSLISFLVITKQLVSGKPFGDESVRTIKIIEMQGGSVLVQNTGNATIESSSLSVYVDSIKSSCKSWSRKVIEPGEFSLCELLSLCSKSVRIYAPDNYDTAECL